MKKCLSFIALAILAMMSYQLKSQVLLNFKGEYKKSGKKTEIKEFFWEDIGSYKVRLVTEGKEEIVGVNTLQDINISIANLQDFWFSQAVNGNVYKNIEKFGSQYDVRKDLEIDALTFLDKLNETNLIYYDSYLENYLYSLVNKLYPKSLDDGRPGIINVMIVNNVEPNAYICPNGTMVITAGLLSIINSEEELLSTMAHEIAHFNLDHYIINVNKATQRQKRAEFWAAVATGVAAAAEIYASSQNEYYYPGALTYSTAILSFSIANEISTRLGLEFSREQELEADKCAVELLKYIDVDPTALSSVLTKIKKYCILNGDYYSLSGSGTHPNIIERIKNIGVPNDFGSTSYDKVFSVIMSQNAIPEFNSKHFIACQNLIKRNIDAGVATEDDYVLLATTNLFLFNNPEKNNEALSFINKAKSLNVVPTINLLKHEGLVLIRLNKDSEAIKALEGYQQVINQEFTKVDNSINTGYLEYLQQEKDWTAKMIYKLKSTKA